MQSSTEQLILNLKAFADPVRLRLLSLCVRGECTVSELTQVIAQSQPRISQHLKQLRNKNIVVARKEANRIFYRIRNHQLLELIGIMRDVLCPANLDDRFPK